MLDLEDDPDRSASGGHEVVARVPVRKLMAYSWGATAEIVEPVVGVGSQSQLHQPGPDVMDGCLDGD
jgi:hypothetical protein